MMKIFSLFRQKKWWALLLLGFMNSAIFMLLFSVAFLYTMPVAILLFILPFILLVWGLNSVSFARFFYTTLVFIGTFILGFPLSGRIYTQFNERLYPEGIYGSGPSLAFFLFLLLYVVMSCIAWIAALGFTLKARKGIDVSGE